MKRVDVLPLLLLKMKDPNDSPNILNCIYFMDFHIDENNKEIEMFRYIDTNEYDNNSYV